MTEYSNATPVDAEAGSGAHERPTATIAVPDPRLRDAVIAAARSLGYSVGTSTDLTSRAHPPVPGAIGLIHLHAPGARTAVIALVTRLTPGTVAALPTGIDHAIGATADANTIAAELALAERRARNESARIDQARRADDDRLHALVASAQRQARELSLLHQVRTALGRHLELPAIFRTVVEATAATFGYSHVSVYLLEAGSTLVLQHQVGYDRVLRRIPIERGIMGRVARTGQPVLIEDVTTEPDFLAAVEDLTSEVAVPFFGQGAVAGVLNVESKGNQRLGAADFRLMSAIGEHLSIAVERARLHEDVRRGAERLRLAMEAAAMGTWDWDVVNGQVYWSEQMGPLYGLPPGTPGLDRGAWFAVIHPDDHKIVFDADDRAIAGDGDYDVEYRVVWPDGTVRWLAGLGRVVERDATGRAARLIGVTMDITSRKRLEEERVRLAQAEAARIEAEEAQRRITDILERITAGFIAIDPEWRFTYVNARAAALLGKAGEDLIGKEIRETLATTVSPSFLQHLRDAVDSQRAVQFDEFLARRDRWLEIHVYPSPDGLSLYLQDVTERRRAAEALQRSEERFRSLVQNASDIIMIVAGDGTVRYASPAIQRVIGLSPQEVVDSGPIWQTFAGDAQRLRRAFNRISRTPGVSPPITVQVRHRDGSKRWLEITATNLLDDPAIGGIVANCRDITERRKAEEDLRFLAETSARLAESLDPATTLNAVVSQAVTYLADWAVIDAIDDHGRIQRVAAAHNDPRLQTRLLQLDRPALDPGATEGPGVALRLGRSVLYSVIDDDLQQQMVEDAETLAEFRRLGFRSAIAVPLVARNSTLGVLSLYAKMPGRYGQPELILAEEVARRAATAIDHARLYNEAQTAIAARDQFLSVAAHELRTPITAMNGFSELLRRELAQAEPESSRVGRYVSRLAEAVARLSALVDDMLDVSRIRLGQLPLRRQPLDLVEFVHRIGSSYEEQLRGSQHTFSCRLPSEPISLAADEDRLEQVLNNLLDNAVKYSPGGGTIVLSLAESDNGALISVQDEGIGLPPEALESIFEPFGRAPNAARSNLPGLGLGLFISRTIVERHGGRLWAESAGESHGTTFYVWLPRSGAAKSPE